MTKTERDIWVATFAAMYIRDFDARHTGRVRGSVDDINGYACAEVANAAVDKFREAMEEDEDGYLYMEDGAR